MLKVAIIGAGLRGRMYAAALADVPEVEVVRFVEPSPRVADAAWRETGIPTLPSHDELLAQVTFDAAIVATPDFAHHAPAVALAEAGTHLLVEKPLAMTVPEARAIRDAVARGGRTCLVGFENRWNPHVQATKRAIEADTIGTPITSSATLSNSWFVPEQMLSWAAKSSPTWFLMPHTVDMLLWLTGRSVQSVSAVASRGVLAARGIDTVDVVHALLTWDDGTTSSLTSSWVLPDGQDAIVDFRYQVIGTEGAITGDPIHQGLDVTTDRRRTQGTLAGRIGMAQVGAPIWMAQEWAHNLLSGKATGPGVEQGVVVTEIVSAIEQSYEAGGATIRLADYS
ncbi:MAG: Gfo/Idh/MocA family oxidoreductase [Thermomicrobiales bacterium]